LGPCGFCPPFYFWPLTALRERKSKAAPGDVCKVVDLLLMIVYSKRKEKKKRLENLERKKNKTQVVLSSPALQVSH